jgi:hypothetical protein
VSTKSLAPVGRRYAFDIFLAFENNTFALDEKVSKSGKAI